MRQTACLAVDPVTVGKFDADSDCTPSVDHILDFMMFLPGNFLFNWSWLGFDAIFRGANGFTVGLLLL